jgi:hypothetical protein
MPFILQGRGLSARANTASIFAVLKISLAYGLVSGRISGFNTASRFALVWTKNGGSQ